MIPHPTPAPATSFPLTTIKVLAAHVYFCVWIYTWVSRLPLTKGRLSSAQPAPCSLVILAHGALTTPLSRSLLRLFPHFSFTFHKTHSSCLVSSSLSAFLLRFLFISPHSSGSLASVLQVSRDTPVRTWSPPAQSTSFTLRPGACPLVHSWGHLLPTFQCSILKIPTWIIRVTKT